MNLIELMESNEGRGVRLWLCEFQVPSDRLVGGQRLHCRSLVAEILRLGPLIQDPQL